MTIFNYARLSSRPHTGDVCESEGVWSQAINYKIERRLYDEFPLSANETMDGGSMHRTNSLS
jgi:hypothetical protein